jgi:tetratricopeptide (TPR) repeat protein
MSYSAPECEHAFEISGVCDAHGEEAGVNGIYLLYDPWGTINGQLVYKAIDEEVLRRDGCMYAWFREGKWLFGTIDCGEMGTDACEMYIVASGSTHSPSPAAIKTIKSSSSSSSSSSSCWRNGDGHAISQSSSKGYRLEDLNGLLGVRVALSDSAFLLEGIGDESSFFPFMGPYKKDKTKGLVNGRAAYIGGMGQEAWMYWAEGGWRLDHGCIQSSEKGLIYVLDEAAAPEMIPRGRSWMGIGLDEDEEEFSYALPELTALGLFQTDDDLVSEATARYRQCKKKFIRRLDREAAGGAGAAGATVAVGAAAGEGGAGGAQEEGSMCHACQKQAATTKCARCKQVYYCGKECQRSHWKGGHKLVCAKLGAGANVAAGGVKRQQGYGGGGGEAEPDSADADAVGAAVAAAQSLLKKQQWQKAAECSNALRIDPRAADALFNRSLALEKLGRLSAAFQDASLSSDIDPTNSQAKKLSERLLRLVEKRRAKPLKAQQKLQRDNGGLDYVLIGKGDMDAGFQYPDPMGRMFFLMMKTRAEKYPDCQAVSRMMDQLLPSAQKAGLTESELQGQLEREYGVDLSHDVQGTLKAISKFEMEEGVERAGSAATPISTPTSDSNFGAGPSSRQVYENAPNKDTTDLKSAVAYVIKQQPLLSYREAFKQLKEQFPKFQDEGFSRVKRVCQKAKQNAQVESKMDAYSTTQASTPINRESAAKVPEVAEMLRCRNPDDIVQEFISESVAAATGDEFERARNPDPDTLKAYFDLSKRAHENKEARLWIELAAKCACGEVYQRRRAKKVAKYVSKAEKLDPKSVPRVLERYVKEMRDLTGILGDSGLAPDQKHSDEAWLAFTDFTRGKQQDYTRAGHWCEALGAYGFTLRTPVDPSSPCTSFGELLELTPDSNDFAFKHNGIRLPEAQRPKLGKCRHCEERKAWAKMKRCLICDEQYCCSACQRADWSTHTPTCRVIFANEHQCGAPEADQNLRRLFRDAGLPGIE